MSVPTRQISKQQVQRLNEAVSKEVTDAFGNADRGTTMHKLGLSMSMLHLLTSNELGAEGDQTLEQYDPEARGILGMRRSQLELLVNSLMAKSEVRNEMAQARVRGLRKIFGSNYKAEIKKFANYILSDKFYASIKNMNPAGRAERLREELLKLAALDPEIAQETSVAFMAKEVEHNPGTILQGLSAAEVTDAIDRVLAVLAGLEDDCTDSCDASLKDVVGDAKKATKVGKTGRKVSAVLRNAQTRRRIAGALQRTMSHKAYYAAIGSDQGSATLAGELAAAGDTESAEVVKAIRKGSRFGRGFATFTSLVALAAIVTSWPPVDSNGNVHWKPMLSLSGGLGSMIASTPTVAKFLGEDLTPMIAKVLGEEFKASRTAMAGAKMAKIANAGKFAKFCKILGPIGDALVLPVTIATVVEEVKNEDVVGTWTNVVGTAAGVAGVCAGIALICGATGVGAPLAAVAAVVGLAAAAVDWMFSESSLTGQVRQDLRYLGISTNEEQTYRDLATTTRTRTVRQRGVQRTFTTRHSLPHRTVRSNAASADTYKKVQLINQYMDGSTSGSEETVIFNILSDTPYDGGQFLSLVEALDTKKLADELEYDGQAACVLGWMSKAYQKANKPPGKALNAYMKELALQHRDEPLNTWLDEVDKGAFHTVDAMAVKYCTDKLMDGHTGNGEETCIYEFLKKSSYPQFNKILENGRTSYARRLRDELEGWQWRNVRAWMMTANEPGKATHTVQHIGVIVR